MFVWLLLIVPVVWTMCFWYRRRHLYRLAAKIPVIETTLPVIGIAHNLVGDTESIMASLQEFSYSSMRQGGIATGWLGHILYFILVDPVDMEHVLKTCLEKDDLHRFIRKIIGYGGIFAPVPIWRRRRKILVPVFSPKIVENFVQVFSEQSQKMTKKMLECAGKGKTSMWPYISTYTLDSVCETTIGVKINAQDNPDSPFLHAMCRVLNLICQRIFHLWLQPDWLYSLFPQFKDHQKCIGLMHGFTDEVIKKKREELKKEKESKTEVDHEFDLGLYRNTTFLDLLIKLSGGEKGYTNEELREETLTLTIAGTDTSAVAMGYTLQLLAKYPEIQEKVHQELYEVFGDSDRPLVKEDLMKLKYLERVIKESMRLFPPVPLIIRKVLEDTKLPSGHVLPAGSGVVCSIWGIHRDPKYWGPDAEQFDPDRFLPERFNLKHPCSYMPFSNGPRNCVGYQYALMSIKTSLSTMLRQFKVVEDREDGPVPRIRVKLDIMMKAVDGYQVALEKRKKVSA
ncbi:cytochrome P450 4C1-like [Anticarsia gemmatalis]|uniref:cytochrome P450 4C1-like n=1 Tax=Anticarsia gemmatalis TaxID=129554 RepID=UPI003F76AF5E